MNCGLKIVLGAACALLVASPAAGQGRITAGETVSGGLGRGDSRMYNGARYDLWTYSGTRGERVVITLRSIQFDAFLLVQPFPGGSSPVLARDDDGARGRDARAELLLPHDGDYVITVTTRERGETGAYRLTLQSDRTDETPPTGDAPVVLARASTAGAAKPSATVKSNPVEARLLVSGQIVTGELATHVRGPLGDGEGDWRFAGRAGETVIITMRSSEFDPYLTLYSLGSSGVTRVAQDDNGAGGLNARMTYTLPSDGEYVVRAERRQPGRSGSYTLSFRSSARASLLGTRAERSWRVRPNSSVSGELDDADPKMHDDTPYELWTYVGRRGETLRITLHSHDFDAFLSIGTVTDGVFKAIESADDGAGGTDSRLDIILPFSGEYAIRANSLSPRRSTGDYVLRVNSIR